MVMPGKTRRVDRLASPLEHSCNANQVGWGKGLWIPAAVRMTGSRDPNVLQIPVGARVTGFRRLSEYPGRNAPLRYGQPDCYDNQLALNVLEDGGRNDPSWGTQGKTGFRQVLFFQGVARVRSLSQDRRDRSKRNLPMSSVSFPTGLPWPATAWWEPGATRT